MILAPIEPIDTYSAPLSCPRIWARVLQANLLSNATLGEEPAVCTSGATDEEVGSHAKKFKGNGASGADDLPAELWKCICKHSPPACRWAVMFCNRV